MRNTKIISVLVILIVALFILVAPVNAKKGTSDGGLKKVIAIGHVSTSQLGFSSLTPKQLAELFKLRAKKQLENTGRYVVIIVKQDDKEAEKEAYTDEKMEKEAEAMSQRTPKTTAEAMKYAAEMQKQFEKIAAKAQGKYVHSPVAAQALFNFNVQTGSKQVSTGGVFGEIEGLTGAPVGGADFSSDSLNLSLTCLEIDPESGSIMGDYQAKASSTRVARVGGVSYYTVEDTSDPDRAFDRMFKRSLEKCTNWIDKRLSSVPWEGQIFKVRGGELLVNAGANAGVTQGMTFGAFERKSVAGKGISLGDELIQTGTVEITNVSAEFASAKAVNGTAKVGSIIKRTDM